MTMPPMTHYNFGDVLLVPFPFSNQQNSKKRPAVVVNSHTYNHYKPDILLMAITSQIKAAPSFGEYEIQDWQHAGLIKTSLLKPLLLSIEKTCVLKSLGQLSVTDLLGLKHSLNIILG